MIDRKEKRTRRITRMIFVHVFAGEGKKRTYLWVKTTPHRVVIHWAGKQNIRIEEFKEFCQHLWDNGNKRTCKTLLKKFEENDLGIEIKNVSGG